MRRYIIVALLALAMAVGCKIEDGTKPQVDGGKRVLWTATYAKVYNCYCCGHYAIFAEALLADNQELAAAANVVLEFDNRLKVEIEPDRVVLTKELSAYDKQIYTITTNGKKLSEGGIWTIHFKHSTNGNGQDTLLATITGTQGSEGVFGCRCQSDSGYTNSDITYTYSVEQGIVATMNFVGEVVDEGSKLTFTTQPQMPFVIANKILKSGAVDIAFEDIERATNRSFTTVVVKAGDLYDHTNIVVYK
jgi:hypothetical protein